MLFGRKFKFNFGSSVEINNGDTEKRQKKNHIDKTETVNPEKVKRISVYSPDVTVRIIDSNKSDIKVHLHSQVYIGEDISLKVDVVEGELKIKTGYKKSAIAANLFLDIEIPTTQLLSKLDVSTSYANVEIYGYVSSDSINVKTDYGDVGINNLYVSKEIFIHTDGGDIEIAENTSSGLINIETSSGDIEIRSKKTGDICIKTDCGDVEIDERTSAENIKIQTSSGDVETEASFANAVINTKKGDVDLAISAERDIDIDISTTKGDVCIELHNIGSMTINPNVPKDNYDNSYVSKGGKYSANVKVATVSGDVDVE